MAFNCSVIQHPREKLPQPAVSVLDTSPEVNFQCGRFFVTRQDFESRLCVLTFHFWTIQNFTTFVKNNINVVIDRGFFYGDLKVFAHFLDNFFLIRYQLILKECLRKFVLIFHSRFL